MYRSRYVDDVSNLLPVYMYIPMIFVHNAEPCTCIKMMALDNYANHDNQQMRFVNLYLDHLDPPWTFRSGMYTQSD